MDYYTYQRLLEIEYRIRELEQELSDELDFFNDAPILAEIEALEEERREIEYQ